MSDLIVVHQRLTELQASTFSVLVTPARQTFVGVERPWLDDQPNISCFAPGEHRVVWAWSPRHGKNVYHVLTDDGRTGIEIDVANWASELRGCLALGRKLAHFPGKGWGVTNSGSSRRRFYREMRGRPFTLRTLAAPA